MSSELLRLSPCSPELRELELDEVRVSILVKGNFVSNSGSDERLAGTFSRISDTTNAESRSCT